MRGEIAYHAGETKAGFDWLHEAIAAEDRLVYNKPRAWVHPPRHALGALLLEQGRIDGARVIYERHLEYDDKLPVSRQNRGNVWSLLGLVNVMKSCVISVLVMPGQHLPRCCFWRTSR